ncbi:histidine phosphatase family protein [Hydrogenophaga sp. 5NK40-0174]|uniref:SixA phosphatase family protein n=1 Tax=Hydrogenophaga sp. 5NK40-0174 TaxID=3127649 RepID=UPI003106105D
MDLILWRHAEAQDHPMGAAGDQGDHADMARRLTPKGEKQAARMARWLDGLLPQGTRIISSPARRAEQTVAALGRKYRLDDQIRPGASADALLDACRWPESRLPVLLVGHQPSLGQVVARLLDMAPGECSVRKGAVWWLRYRERDDESTVVVRCVMAPDML